MNTHNPFKIRLSAVPKRFWAIMIIAVMSGLIVSLLYSFAENRAELSRESTAPDQFETVKSQIPEENLKAGYQKVTGAWRAKQGDTEMLLQLYANGYFRWRVNDNRAPDYVLLAQGRYLITAERIMLKEDRTLPFKRNLDNRFTKFRHLDVSTASLPWRVQGKTLNLSLENNPSLPPNFSRLLSEMSGESQVLSFDFLGTP